MSWQYFKLADFACKHCGENKIDPRLIDKAFEVTLGYAYRF